MSQFARRVPIRRARSRRGGMMALLAFLLIVVIAAAAFTIDVAYMQLVQTELQVSLDASTRAAVGALADAKSPAQARAEAIRVAKLNPVAGGALTIKDADVQVGAVTRSADGSYVFAANQTPYSAVRINKELSEASGGKSVALFLGGFLGRDNFSPSQSSTSAFYEQEIVLVIDRSHSMCFDMTGVDWSYPSGIGSGHAAIKKAPHATHSRWAAARSAIETFVDTVEEVSFEKPRISLVTWGSNIGTGSVEYSLTGKTEVEVKRDVALTDDYDAIKTAVGKRSEAVMLGGTNLSAGMSEGIDVLTESGVKPFAKRVMIVMTDGQWNQGADPLVTAQAIADEGIVIHCVTFLNDSGQSTMEDVAEIGGGRHFYASDEEDLADVFEELARMLPVVTVE